MSITRMFVDWKKDSSRSLFEILRKKYVRPNSSQGTAFDCSDVLIVLPGRRAGRRLLHLLAHESAENSWIFTPPKITTPGGLPEFLYTPRRPFASEIIQRLTWVSALRNLRRGATKILGEIPPDDDLNSWLDYCDLFRKTHMELAGEGFDFREVILKSRKIPGFTDEGKWRFLRKLQQKYLELLDAQGLWDRQTARLVAIEKHECETAADIFVAGTVDLNRSTQMMLDQVAKQVTSIVFAPEELADRFDHYGCLLPGYWEEAKIRIDDNDIMVADGSEDVAAAAIECLSDWQSKYFAEEVNVAIADHHLVPEIQQQMQVAGVANEWAGGHPVRQTLPFQLVNSIGAFIASGRFSEFASLVRHPHVFRWIMNLEDNSRKPPDDAFRPTDVLSELDEYYNEHLQPRLGFWLGSQDKNRNIRFIHDRIQDLFAPLQKPRYRRLCQWAPLISQILAELYQGFQIDSTTDSGQASITSLQRIQNRLAELVSISESISPNVTAATAFDILIKLLESESVNLPVDPDEIELIGWLDLALDDARATVVTSFNEGFLPQSVNADILLPNSMRKRLRLTDNSARYARDAYLLSWLAASRKELKLVVGRRGVDGDPLLPSRLLFATEKTKIAPRVSNLFGSGWNIKIDKVLNINDAQDPIVVRKPPPLEQPVTAMSVTAFRNYIACPYYFYLKHVLKLESLDDAVSELSPPAFGNAIHDVLEAFGLSDLRDSQNSDEIRSYLRDLLDRYFVRVFGKATLPAVDVQKRQTRLRLDAFANWQANWTQKGWQIKHTEIAAKDTFVELDDGRQMQLNGRIDRIDYHAETKTWAVLDYKTGDRFKTPEKAHRQSGEWIDLQLPLYRMICRNMGLEGTYRLGYITLPKDLTQIGEHFAEWSDEELDEAEDTAKAIVADVLKERFWPMTQPAHIYRREYAAICQDNVFEPMIETVEVDAS